MYNIVLIDNRPSDYKGAYSAFFISKDLRTAIGYFTKEDSKRFEFKNKKEAEQVIKNYIKLNNIKLNKDLQIKIVKNKEVVKLVTD